MVSILHETLNVLLKPHVILAIPNKSQIKF